MRKHAQTMLGSPFYKTNAHDRLNRECEKLDVLFLELNVFLEKHAGYSPHVMSKFNTQSGSRHAIVWDLAERSENEMSVEKPTPHVEQIITLSRSSPSASDWPESDKALERTQGLEQEAFQYFDCLGLFDHWTRRLYIKHSSLYRKRLEEHLRLLDWIIISCYARDLTRHHYRILSDVSEQTGRVKQERMEHSCMLAQNISKEVQNMIVENPSKLLSFVNLADCFYELQNFFGLVVVLVGMHDAKSDVSTTCRAIIVDTCLRYNDFQETARGTRFVELLCSPTRASLPHFLPFTIENNHSTLENDAFFLACEKINSYPIAAINTGMELLESGAKDMREHAQTILGSSFYTTNSLDHLIRVCGELGVLFIELNVFLEKHAGHFLRFMSTIDTQSGSRHAIIWNFAEQSENEKSVATPVPHVNQIITRLRSSPVSDWLEFDKALEETRGLEQKVSYYSHCLGLFDRWTEEHYKKETSSYRKRLEDLVQLLNWFITSCFANNLTRHHYRILSDVSKQTGCVKLRKMENSCEIARNISNKVRETIVKAPNNLPNFVSLVGCFNEVRDFFGLVAVLVGIHDAENDVSSRCRTIIVETCIRYKDILGTAKGAKFELLCDPTRPSLPHFLPFEIGKNHSTEKNETFFLACERVNNYPITAIDTGIDRIKFKVKGETEPEMTPPGGARDFRFRLSGQWGIDGPRTNLSRHP